MAEIQHAQPTPPPGWYPDPAGSGHHRWWDGRAWGQYAPAVTYAPASAPVFARPPKDTAVAYLLWFLLGALGIYNFYLGRTGPAVTQLVLVLVAWATAWIGVGFLILFGLGIWVIVDAFLIPGFVRRANGLPY